MSLLVSLGSGGCPNGRASVLTYHHRSERAWWALGEALVRSGLQCTGVISLRGEGQGGLHSYEGTIKWDAVLVCRPGKGLPVIEKGTLVVSPDEIIERTRWPRLGRSASGRNRGSASGPPTARICSGH